MIIIEKLAYSFHLGNDKNKTKKARQVAKTNKTGTTSFNNNGIQTTKQLSKVFNHNYRMYEKNQNEIYVLKGTKDLIQDVKDLYLDIFEESRIKYNDKQTRSDRKIDNYFNHISNSEKSDLACEIIIELGDMDFWEDKNKLIKLRMNEVFKEQIKYLENIVPNFKVASAVSHFDESSPHLHIVGVPFKTSNKNGMEIQVGKSAIFTKESLKVIQDKMRINCIEKFNEVYEIDFTLKDKKKGRNSDLKSAEMEEYKKEEKLIKNQIKQLEEVKKSNTKTIEKQEEQKTKIEVEIESKKKYNHKIVLKDKQSLIKENDELKAELRLKNHQYKMLEENYTTLKSKVDYIINAIKKVLSKIPSSIIEMIETLFDKNQSIFTYEHNQLVKKNQEKINENWKNNDFTNYEELEVKDTKEKDDFER